MRALVILISVLVLLVAGVILTFAMTTFQNIAEALK